MESKNSVEILSQRILQLLDAKPHNVSEELCDLLNEYREIKQIEFGTKMERLFASLAMTL